MIQTLRGPGGASIDCSSAPSLPVAAFSTADRACDVASDALSRDPPRTWPRDRIPFAWGRWIHLRRRLVKDDDLAGSERLPSTSSPSPWASGFRRRRVGSRGACHRSRCSRAHGSRHCDPASGAASPAEPPVGRARGLDPWPLDQDPAPLVDFCNPNNPRARPRDRPIPPCTAGSSWEQAPRPGSRKRPHSPSVRSRAPLAPGALALEVLTRCGGLRLALVACTSARARALASVTLNLSLAASVRRWASTSRLRLQAEPRPCGLGLTGAVTIASRGFTGQGPTGVHRRHLSLRESFYPNPIRSDTSCREIDASSAGDSDVAGDALPETQRGIRLSRSRHTPRTPAKGRARVPPMTCLREAAGPESHQDTPARMTRTPPGAKGRITRSSAKKSGISRTRGAFHR